MPEKERKLPANLYTFDPFKAWVLLDYVTFSISRLRDIELAQCNLTHEQSAILQILVRKKGRSKITEISLSWMRKPNSVNTLINRMEKQGMVTKTKKPKQRELEIEITKKGQDLCNQIPGVVIDNVFSILSPEDIQKFTQYLILLFIRARTLQGDHDNYSFLL